MDGLAFTSHEGVNPGRMYNEDSIRSVDRNQSFRLQISELVLTMPLSMFRGAKSFHGLDD